MIDKLIQNISLVAFSAAISIVVTTFILDNRYRETLEGNSLDLPEISISEIKKQLNSLPKVLAYNVNEKTYSVVSKIADLENSLIVFSDFNCIYCAKNYSKYNSFSSKNGITSIYFIETPILGDDSRKRALFSIDGYLLGTANYERKKYYDETLDVPINNSDEAEFILSKHEEVISSFGINATPAYLVKGKLNHALN